MREEKLEKKKTLSKRLSSLVDAVQASRRLIDVGCDHGLVSIGLAYRDDIEQILATDISAPSLAKLELYVEEEPQQIQNKIQCQLADGLKGLIWDWTDGILIAGMGGDLIIEILERNTDLVESAQQILLSPHSQVDKVRLYMEDFGFPLAGEDILWEGGHYYEILDFRKKTKENQKRWPPIQYRPWTAYYGNYLIDEKNPLVKDRMDKDLDQIKRILDQLQGQIKQGKRKLEGRFEQLENDKVELEKVLAEWEGENYVDE